MSNDNQSAEGGTRKITAGFVISWILAVLFGVPGIMMLFEGKALAGLLFILAALVLLPPLNVWVEKRFKLSLSGMLKTIVVLVLVIGAGSLSVSSQSPSSIAAAPSTASNASSNPATASQPPIKVSASALSQAYDSNEVAADAKYKGNVVDVSGTIDTIGKDILGTPYVSLKTSEYSIIGVQCMFSQSDEAALAALSSGQTITLEGTVSGKTIEVIVDGCSIVK